MKLSVCGKGGSGKSVIVTLLANELKSRGYRVLIVDSDESNSGLYRVLGFDAPPIPLMDLVGGKRTLQGKMLGRFSSGQSEHKMEVMSQATITVKDIPPEHIKERDSIRLVNIGKILRSLEGCACPMGVLSREFLAKLSLDRDEVAIVDMEAGVEHFGRGVETSMDAVLIVVEPSFESLELAPRVKQLAAGAGVGKIWVILNKVTSGEMATKLEGELARRGAEVLGTVRYDPEVFQACLEGRAPLEGMASKGIRKTVDSMLSKAGVEGRRGECE
jgi:CO dehydrogenase maturation factor